MNVCTGTKMINNIHVYNLLYSKGIISYALTKTITFCRVNKNNIVYIFFFTATKECYCILTSVYHQNILNNLLYITKD